MTACPLCGADRPDLAKYSDDFPNAAKRLIESVESGHQIARARAAAGFNDTLGMIVAQMEHLGTMPSGLDAPGVCPPRTEPATDDEAERFGWMVRTGMEMNGWSLAESVAFAEWTLQVEDEGL